MSTGQDLLKKYKYENSTTTSQRLMDAYRESNGMNEPVVSSLKQKENEQRISNYNRAVATTNKLNDVAMDNIGRRITNVPAQQTDSQKALISDSMYSATNPFSHMSATLRTAAQNVATQDKQPQNTVDWDMERKLTNNSEAVMNKLTGNDGTSVKQQNQQRATDYIDYLNKNYEGAQDYLNEYNDSMSAAEKALVNTANSAGKIYASTQPKNNGTQWNSQSRQQNIVDASTNISDANVVKTLQDQYHMSESEARYWASNYGTLKGILDNKEAEETRNAYIKNYSSDVLTAMNDYVKAKRDLQFEPENTVISKTKSHFAYLEAKKKLEEMGINPDDKGEYQQLYEYMYANYGAEENAQIQSYISNLVEKYPATTVALNLYDVGMSPVSGLMATAGTLINDATKMDKSQPSDTNAAWYMPQNMSTAIQNATIEEIDKTADKFGVSPAVGEFAYGVGSSTAKSLYSMALGGNVGQIASTLGASADATRVIMQLATLPSFGGTAYASTLQEQLDKGLGQEQAQAYAIVSGINEMLYEELSLDKAYGIYTANAAGKVSWQKTIMNMLAQAGIEGSEEVFTELSNRFADAIINTDFSQHNINVRQYMEMGYTEAQAEEMVKQEELKQLLETFFAGAVSGGITGAATTVAGKVNYNKTAKNIVSDNAKVQALYDQTKMSAAEGSTASDIVNSKAANELTESDVANILESLNETGSESTEDFLTQAFMNRGESEEQAKQDAQLVLDISNTDLSDTLTDEEIEQRYFDNSELTDDERYKVKTANEIEQRNAAAIEANPNLANVLADYNSGKLQNPTTIAQVAMQVAKNENNAARAEKISNTIDAVKNKVNTIADKVSGRSNSFVIGNTKSGQVGVMSFDDVSQNRAIVNTNQGKMDITDIDLGRSNEAMILKTGAEYENTKAANYLIDDYSGQDLQAYVSLSRYAYNLGQNGQPLSTLFNDKSVFIKNSLDSLQKMDQYNEHIMRMYNAGLETRSERSVEKVNAEKAKAVQNKLDVAKDDKLYDFKSVIRDYTQANVLTDYAETRFNAAWITDTATLKTSANATNEYAAIVHEMFEFSRAMAPKEYEALKQAVLELAHDKLGYTEVQNAIKQYQNAYRTADIKSEAKKTLSEATDEFVNDFMAGAFSTESGAQQFIEHVANNDKYSANEKASIFQSFADWVNHLLDTIKEFLTGKQQLGAKKALELEKMGVSLENIRDMALKAMDAAKVELNSQLMNDVVSEDNSKAEDFMGGELYSENDIEEASKANYSLSFDESLMKAAIKENGRKDSKRNNANIDVFVMDRAKAVRNITRNELLKYQKFLPEDNMGNIFVNNSSYSRSGENSLICVRSLVSGYFTDLVSERVGHPLSVEQQIITSQILAGLTDDQTECTYCYVKNDRMTYRAMFNSYYEQYTTQMDKVKANRAAYENDIDFGYEEFLDGRKDTKQMHNRYLHFVKDALAGNKSLRLKDMTTAKTRSQFTGKNTMQAWLVRDAERYAQSAAWAKSTSRKVKVNGTNRSLEYVAYNGNILKWDQKVIDDLNSGFGLRMYSDSDYVPAFLLENMQVVTDAAVRGLKMLSYTKDCGFTRVFGGTGMGINISCFGFWDEASQTVLMDGMMGADWEEAKAVRSRYGNVGTVFVATNDNCLNWALDQDWIDVVIPFHLVRTGKDIAAAYGYKDYKSQQEDKKNSAWDKEKNLKSIPPTVHANDRDTYFKALEENNLKPRFEQYKDHPNYMKLVNETRMSYKDMKPVQPIFDLDEVRKELARIPKEGAYGLLKGIENVETQDRLLEGYVDEAVKKIQALPTKESFSLDVPVEKTDKLIALHNLTEDKLLSTIELGGFPMPSIAIMRLAQAAENSQYGNISVMFGSDVIDPKASKLNKVYSGDAWTPTFPAVSNLISRKVQEKVSNKIENLIGKEAVDGLRLALDYSNMEDSLRSGDAVSIYAYKTGMKYAYLKDTGKQFELPTIEKRYQGKGGNEELKVLLDLLQEKGFDISNYEYGSEDVKALQEDIRVRLNQFWREKIPKFNRDFYDAENFGFSDVDNLMYKARKMQSDIDEYGKIPTEVDYYEAREMLDKTVDSEDTDFRKWLGNLFEGIVEKQGIRNNLDTFTSSGNRRSWNALHDEITLENVVKAMRSDVQKGAGIFGMGSPLAAATKEFSSIDDIRKSKGQLRTIDKTEYDNIRKEFIDRFSEIAARYVKQDSRDYSAVEDAGSAIIEAVGKSKTKASLDNKLRADAKWFNYSKEIVDDIWNLVLDIQKMPSGYFEAKPARAVGFNEIRNVIIPDNSSEKLIDSLNRNNIPYTMYKANDEQDRIDKLNNVAEDTSAAFSLDVPYMDAVNSGDLETAQKLVEQAAREAGYEYNVYHGSRKIFNSFSKEELGSNTKTETSKRWFFSADKETANSYYPYGVMKELEKNNPRMFNAEELKPDRRGKLYNLYLKAENPLVVDVLDYDYASHREKADAWMEYVNQAEENGNDAIILLNAMDNQLKTSARESTVYMFREPNQVKSADTVVYDDSGNIIPLSQRFSDNNDIRYSIDVGDENFNAAIQEMMDDISGGVDRLANNMSKVMDFKSDISKRMIINVAKNIKKIYGSDIKSKDLEEKLMRMFNYLRETGSINAKDIELIRTSIGEQVVDSIKADDPAAAAEYDKFVSGIKTWDIALDEGQMQEVKNKFDSYYGFKRYMAGKLSLNKNGTLLDDIWTEICDLSGGALSYGTNPNNQPIALAEYINKLEPKARILDEQSYEEASMSVALEVFRQFFNETSKKDAAEFMRDEIKEYNKAVKQRYQKLYNEALKEVEKAKAAELERLKQEYEKLTIEEQAAMAEGIGELESVQIQQLKEDTKKRIDELKKQNNEAIAKVKADYRNRKLTERANRAWIDTKRKLVKEIESLQNMLAHPKEAATKHVPIHLVLSTIDLLEAIQMDTGRNKAITERLAKLASVYESYKTDLNNDDGTNYGFDYDERIAADIAEVKAMFDNGRFYTDLYTPEMERLLEIVRALKTQIKNANNLIIDGQVRDARDVALDAIAEVKNSRTESKNYVTDALDRYGNQHLNPYRLMRKLSGYTDGAMMKLYDNLEEGGMREMQIQQQLNDIYKDVLEGSKNQKEIKRFISTKPNDLVDIGIVDETGKSVKVSRAMRMSIIMHSFNENNMRHILYGGLTIPDMKVYSQNKSKAYSEYGDVYRFLNYKEYLQAVKSNDKAKQNKMLADAKKKVDALQDDLSEWEKKFLAAAKKMFHEETGRLINDTSIALKGYTIARVKNYFPIKTDTDFTPTDFAGLVQNGTIEGMGMLKERVTSKKPMMLEDITDVIQRQIRNTSKYAAYAIPVRNFKMAMRQTFKDKRGEGTTLEKNIRKVWNVQNVDNLRNMLTAIETGKGRGEETFKVLNKIRANFAGAVLSINPSVAIKQAASYPTAAAVVGYLPLIQAVKDMPKGFAQAKGIEELEKRNPLLWYRAQGYGSQDLADAKASALINKLPTKLQKALGWTQFMDTGTVRTLEYAAKHYVDNNFKSLEKGSDAYWNKVSEVFTQVVTETQPNYDTLHKATIIRDGDSLAKMLVMFKTQPMQNFGILYDALGELDANINRYNRSKSDANKAKVKDSASKFAYAVTSQLMSAVTFSAMSIIARLALHKIGRYRKGELEEWSWLAVLKEFAEGIVSCLTGMLLGGSEIYETATYYAGKNKYYSGIEVSSVEALNDFTTNTKYLVDATTNLWEAKTTAERDEASQKIAKYSVKVGNYAGQLLGIPTGNIYNIIQSIYLYGVDAVTSVENGKLTISSKTDVTDWEVATQYERMYDAVVNDDMDEYNKLVTEMINTGREENYIVGKVKSMIKDEYFSESKDRLETIENLVDIGFSEAEASHTVNQWYTGYKETNEYGPTKTLIRTAADDPSDANRKAVVEEVRNLMELGKTKDNFAKQLKQEFKDEYNEGDNKVNLNAILRQALVAAGYTDEEAAEVLAKWSK